MPTFMIPASVPRPLPTDTASPHTSPRPVIDAQVDWEVISRRLRRYAIALTGDIDQAEDLAQQTISALLTKAPQHADHMGYARQTLTRLWLDRERSVRRRIRRLLSLAAGSVAWTMPREAPAEMHEQLGRLQTAIAALPSRQRAAITLRLVEGLEYAQIAEALGCDIGAVRANLHLARARLRHVLEDSEPTVQR